MVAHTIIGVLFKNIISPLFRRGLINLYDAVKVPAIDESIGPVQVALDDVGNGLTLEFVIGHYIEAPPLPLVIIVKLSWGINALVRDLRICLGFKHDPAQALSDVHGQIRLAGKIIKDVFFNGHASPLKALPEFSSFFLKHPSN